MAELILAIDAGTTGVSVFLFDQQARAVRAAYSEFPQHYPRPGWVEHDPEQIWQTVLALLREATEGIEPGRIAAIGLTNQRETTVVWHRKTGRPVANAIVWQCRRTAPLCQRLRDAGHTDLVRRRTGLLLDPYFSATKLAWLLEAEPARLAAAARGELAFGTIDAWLLWKLTGGRVHATDVTNASRTLLFDIHRRCWDDELLDLFHVPRQALPSVLPSTGDFGRTEHRLLGRAVPIRGVAGDQQAALAGQLGFRPGDAKHTYGTGAFLLVNTGSTAVASQQGLLTTIACDAGGAPVYALEGSVFVAGAAVQWLRDGLGIIDSAAQTAALAASVPDSGGVTVVPAFSGLGAPYWDSAARGGILGLTRSTTRAHVVRATLEGIAQQTADLIEAANADLDSPLRELRVDGKAAANDFLMQCQADLLGIPIDRPENVDTTALGAALLAGIGSGFWANPDELSRLRKTERRFIPASDAAARQGQRDAWRGAVRRILTGCEQRVT